jgi:hypothetical protein
VDPLVVSIVEINNVCIQEGSASTGQTDVGLVGSYRISTVKVLEGYR